MGKRAADPAATEVSALKGGSRPQKPNGGADDIGEFEDEFEDEFESEDEEDDELLEAGVDGRPDAEREAEEQEHGCMQVDTQTFMLNRNKLGPGETLAPDPSTYEMLHTLTTTWPCLSFDIIPDSLGTSRSIYPATVYAVAGTQASSTSNSSNELIVMKLSGLSRMDRLSNPTADSDSDSDSDVPADTEPILESRSIPLDSTTNRIRAHQSPPANSSLPPTTLTATMTEAGPVLIHDVTPMLTFFDTPGTIISPQQRKPLATLRMHGSTEGYALDWSSLHPSGKLLTGDNDGKIFTTTRTESGAWVTDTRPYSAHTSSVEELQWSPSERNVFASASSDGTVKVWDLRSKSHSPALSVRISQTDVNVMSWSKQTSHLLATGADDGVWAVWDLRQWKPTATGPGGSGVSKDISSTPIASFDFHKEQITSIEWHPTDDSIVAVAAGDHTLTLWDLAVELDDEESRDTAGIEGVPPQLLFVHYMENVKECHWHKQMPGVVVGTGGAGFGVFKTISV